jgi:hypothetical protein
VTCYQITSSEKGQTVAVLAGFNAVGDYVPLLFVLKEKLLQPSWCIGSPPSSLVHVSENGWINAQLLMEWGKKFVSILPKGDNSPHLLLFDGHSSHFYNVPFLNLMKEHNVHPFVFPPHCSYILQPCDKSLFKSVKHHWNQDGWNKTKKSGGTAYTEG